MSFLVKYSKNNNHLFELNEKFDDYSFDEMHSVRKIINIVTISILIST